MTEIALTKLATVIGGKTCPRCRPDELINRPDQEPSPYARRQGRVEVR